MLYSKACRTLKNSMELIEQSKVISVASIPGHFKLSWKGFTVALFYCFLNTEVQNTVRHHLQNWKTRRSLGPSRLRSGSRSKDWSPRSRTESIRHENEPSKETGLRPSFP
ncbi:hypothetical protein NQ315_006059 [Exocentrus adspersus]|uniref:Uncharacterized protein n=1 Tax=Exocentrus adspersus TaxID=1586481 RepID=A0AAV8VFK7_9CUCU|nr:hypothetical protein NQ315_006059 [Exocentrus adspersus]